MYPTVLQVKDKFYIFLSLVKMSINFKIKKKFVVSYFLLKPRILIKNCYRIKREAKGYTLNKIVNILNS